MSDIVLEHAAQDFADATAKPPLLDELGVEGARKLVQAGVPTTTVRHNAGLHEFMMLNPVRGTQASTAAIEQATHALRKVLGTG